jgi:HEAT repeat protein
MYVYRPLLILLFCLGSVASLAGNGYAQKSASTRIEPEVALTTPFARDINITLRPCQGQPPGNVLGVDEKASVDERVMRFTRKLRDADPMTRACAAKQLGYLGREASNASPDLIKLLHDEESDGVRGNVADALWTTGPAEMPQIRELIELAKDTDVYVRLYASFALGYFMPQFSDQKKVVNALIAATKDQDNVVRWVAVKGLARLGSIARDAVPTLIQTLHDQRPPLRAQAITALGLMGADALEAVPALLDVLYQTDDYATQLRTAMSLARIGPEILPLLKNEINTDHSLHILEVLHYLGEPGVPLVIEAMRAKDPRVRKKAIETIGTLGAAAAPAVPLLGEALRDKDQDIRDAAVMALYRLGPVSSRAVPALTAALNDGNSQCFAALALGEIGSPAKSSAGMLLKLMTQSDKEGRFALICFARALIKMSPETNALVPADVKAKVADWNRGSTPYQGDAKKPKPQAQPQPKPTTVY